MIKLLNRAVLLLVLCAVTSVPLSAKTITKKVTFNRDVTVAGTVVKAGTYKAAYDDTTGELSIIKGTETVAKTQARIEKISKDARRVYSTRAGSALLVSVTLKDGNLAVIENVGESAGERAQ